MTKRYYKTKCIRCGAYRELWPEQGKDKITYDDFNAWRIRLNHEGWFIGVHIYCPDCVKDYDLGLDAQEREAT